MSDLGAPASYLTLAEGTPVYSSDREELGRVEHVLAEPDADVFDGIVIDTARLLPGGHRFVDAAEVEEIYERGVVLDLAADDAHERLHEPRESPAALGAHPGEGAASELERKLHRAWELLSGRG